MGCTQCPQYYVPGEHGHGLCLHIVVMLWLQNLHIHVPQDFWGKKKTTQVTAPYQILPLCEGAAPWDYMYTGHTKTLSRAVVFIIVTLYRDSCAIWTSLASLIRIPYRPLARQLSLVQIMDTSGCITMCRVLFTKIIKLLAGTIWRV